MRLLLKLSDGCVIAVHKEVWVEVLAGQRNDPSTSYSTSWGRFDNGFEFFPARSRREHLSAPRVLAALHREA